MLKYTERKTRMKSIIIIVITVVCFLILGACSCDNNGTSIPGSSNSMTLPGSSHGNSVSKVEKISAEEAKQMMDSSSSFLLLDVRTESEYNKRHIEGAVLIPNDEIKTRATAELSDKNQLIIVYCASGTRSASATATLVGMGYTNVYDLGSIDDWPYTTISGTDGSSNSSQGMGSASGNNSSGGGSSTGSGSSAPDNGIVPSEYVGSPVTVTLDDGSSFQAVFDKATGLYKTEDDRYFSVSKFTNSGWLEIWPYPISNDKKVYKDVADNYGRVLHVWYSPIDRYYYTSDGTSYAIIDGHWVTIGP